jgi:arylsulfatase A-like enzyme
MTFCLRRGGVTFSRTYADCPLCVPARVSIMTGQQSPLHGQTGNGPTGPHIPRERSLPSVLRSQGYNLGRVFAALLDFDLLDETLIVYTSDHGEFLGDHRLAAKSFLLEGATRVPLVIRPPRSWGMAPGAVSEALATHADLLPTLAAAAGGVTPAACDGMNLLAVARGERPLRPFLHGVTGRADSGPGPVCLGVTDGRWKYLYYPEGPAEQLFDLATDPRDLTDLDREHVSRDNAPQRR